MTALNRIFQNMAALRINADLMSLSTGLDVERITQPAAAFLRLQFLGNNLPRLHRKCCGAGLLDCHGSLARQRLAVISKSRRYRARQSKADPTGLT